MKSLPLILCCAVCCIRSAFADSIAADFQLLINDSCIGCHDEDTETGLNLAGTASDLTDPDTFRIWEKVSDRVHAGEMPPEAELRPDPKLLKPALDSLRHDLLDASRERQKKFGRVPARRPTKQEFGYTIRDLLLIDSDVTAGIPDEVESGNFNTVGSLQRISGLHRCAICS